MSASSPLLLKAAPLSPLSPPSFFSAAKCCTETWKDNERQGSIKAANERNWNSAIHPHWHLQQGPTESIAKQKQEQKKLQKRVLSKHFTVLLICGLFRATQEQRKHRQGCSYAVSLISQHQPRKQPFLISRLMSESCH